MRIEFTMCFLIVIVSHVLCQFETDVGSIYFPPRSFSQCTYNTALPHSPDTFGLRDKQGEKQFRVDLKQSLLLARGRPLFQGTVSQSVVGESLNRFVDACTW